MGGLDKRGRKVRNERKVKKINTLGQNAKFQKEAVGGAMYSKPGCLFMLSFELGLACAACLLD